MDLRILHIDMDAFFASVEQQINPALKGKPVIVGARDSKFKTVVTASSYEAKAYGIKAGMPSWEAFKICPHAQFVACDTARYTHVSREILKMLDRYSPHVEHTTIDEFDLDVRGLETLWGSLRGLGEDIKRTIREAFGITCSIGIAATWTLAKLGSKLRKPDGLTLIDEANLDSLIQGLPVEKICGIGPALTRYLQALGIHTCDQLKKMPEETLINNFGRTTGHWLHAILRTEENTTFQKGHLDSDPTPKSIGHSYTLPQDTYDPRIAIEWLRMLSEMVAERTRNQDLTGSVVTLWVSFKNESFLRQKTHPIPTDDGAEIFRRAKAIFDQKKPKISGVRALGVTLSGLKKNNPPPLLNEQKRRGALLRSIDRINARHGDWTIHPASIDRISHPR